MSSVPSSEMRVREAIDSFVRAVRGELDTHLATLAAELLRTVHSLPAGGAGGARGVAGVTRALIGTEAPDTRIDLLARLLAAMRRLDQAETLSDILDALARGVSSEATRVLMLLIEGDVLRSWRAFGFTGDQRPYDVPYSSYPALERAVHDRQRATITPGGANEAASPSFLRVPRGHAGLIIPIVVGGHVVALFYAEGPDRVAALEGANVWAEQAEVLVRHAASRLENVTSLRTVEVLTSPD